MLHARLSEGPRGRERLGLRILSDPAELRNGSFWIPRGSVTTDDEDATIGQERCSVSCALAAESRCRPNDSVTGSQASTEPSGSSATPRPPITRTRPSDSRVAVWASQTSASAPAGANVPVSAFSDLRRGAVVEVAILATDDEHAAIDKPYGLVSFPGLDQSSGRGEGAGGGLI